MANSDFHEGQDALWRLPKVIETIGICKSLWWQWVKDGQAPQPVRLGRRLSLWRASDIYAFVEQLANKGLPPKNGGKV